MTIFVGRRGPGSFTHFPWYPAFGEIIIIENKVNFIEFKIFGYQFLSAVWLTVDDLRFLAGGRLTVVGCGGFVGVSSPGRC